MTQPNEEPLTPDQALAAADRIAAHTRRMTAPRHELLMAAWGLAYGVGLGVFWWDLTRQDGAPLLGYLALACAFVAAAIVTAVEVRSRLNGLTMSAGAVVRRSIIIWVSVSLLWSTILLVSSRNAAQGETQQVAATAIGAAVALVGVWYLASNLAQTAVTTVGIGLASIGIASLSLDTPNHALLLSWVGSTVVFFIGAGIALAGRRQDGASEGRGQAI